jgi:serine/threonine protein kinase
MGQVFLVKHPRLPRQDALKLLDAGVSRNRKIKVWFQRVADLLAQLSHPHIVTRHDRGEFEKGSLDLVACDGRASTGCVDDVGGDRTRTCGVLRRPSTNPGT